MLLLLLSSILPAVGPVQPQALTPTSVLSVTPVRAALIDARAGNREHAISLGIDLAGFNWFQEVDIGQPAVPSGAEPVGSTTVFLVSRHLSGEIFVFGPDGRIASRRAINEPVTYQPIDLDDDGVMELMVEEIDDWGNGPVYETGYHIYGGLTEGVRQLWSAPAVWLWSKPNPDYGRGLLRFEWRWHHRGPLVLYFADGVKGGKKLVRREAWEYLNGKFTRTRFPRGPGV
ncbi:MAG: hypothetical protein ACHP7P_14715 [Terriglobales bacterium]